MPVNRMLRLEEGSNRQLTEQAQKWAQRHLSASGKRGRPAIVSGYVEWLLRQHTEPQQAPRASNREVRRVESSRVAAAAYSRAWGRHPGRLHPFPETATIARRVAPWADRPARVTQAVYNFCAMNVLAPLYVHTGAEIELVRDPRIDLVPEYQYVSGQLARPMLEEFAPTGAPK